MKLLISAFFWFVVFRIILGQCPLLRSTSPCSCSHSESSGYTVTCTDIEEAESLRRAVEDLQGQEVAYFILRNSTLNYLPHDLLKGIMVKAIDIDQTSFISFSDTDVAFVGLEDHLEVLSIMDCSLMSDWRWGHLRNLKSLFRIDIVGGDMDSIGDDVSKIGHLPIEDLAFSRNEISWIQNEAFATFKDLLMLTLDNNEITELKRSMIPKPADKLRLLDLSHNRIMMLPNDFFSEMPALTDLFLHHNQMFTINENVFAPIWKQLDAFGFTGNKLRCDCRVTWILRIKLPDEDIRNRRLICAEPQRLQGMFLLKLIKDDLWC